MTPILTLARRLGFVPVRLSPAERAKLTEYERAINDIDAMGERYHKRHPAVIRARQAKVNVQLGSASK